MTGWSPGAAALAALLPATARGPRREGIYALWLVVRYAEDLGLVPPLPERVRRRRIDALAHRLSSLTVPPGLRRALTGALAALGELTPDAGAIALQQLAAPARETVGSDAGDALALAARAARTGRTAESAAGA